MNIEVTAIVALKASSLARVDIEESLGEMGEREAVLIIERRVANTFYPRQCRAIVPQATTDFRTSYK
jgi:hypothetical protein